MIKAYYDIDSVRDRAPIFRATRTKIFLIAAALVSQIGHLEFDTFQW